MYPGTIRISACDAFMLLICDVVRAASRVAVRSGGQILCGQCGNGVAYSAVASVVLVAIDRFIIINDKAQILVAPV